MNHTDLNTVDDSTIEIMLCERLTAAGHKTGLECIEDWTKTDDTVADFLHARHSYNESGRLVTHTDDVLVIQRAQIVPGEPRRDVRVVDLGTHRFVSIV